MKQFTVLLKKDFMELWRTKKLLAICIIFVVFGLVSPIMANLMPLLLSNVDGLEIIVSEPTVIDSYNVFANNIGEMFAWIMVGVIGGQIVSERIKGQYTTLRNNGVSSWQFICSKITSQIIMITVCYLLSILVFSLYNLVLFDEFLIQYSFVFFFGLYLYLIFLISLMALYGTLLKNSVTVIISAIVTSLLLNLFNFFTFGRYLPSGLNGLSMQILNDKNVMSDLYIGVVISFSISLSLIFLSVYLCSNKE